MRMTFEKDNLGKHYRIEFDDVPKKIKNLKEKLKPMERYYLQELDAEIYFGENPDGTCSDVMQLKFNSTSPYCNHYWTFHKDTNGKTWSFVNGSIMAENLLGCEERPVYKVIAEYFSN